MCQRTSTHCSIHRLCVLVPKAMESEAPSDRPSSRLVFHGLCNLCEKPELEKGVLFRPFHHVELVLAECSLFLAEIPIWPSLFCRPGSSYVRTRAYHPRARTQMLERRLSWTSCPLEQDQVRVRASGQWMHSQSVTPAPQIAPLYFQVLLPPFGNRTLPFLTQDRYDRNPP